MQKMRSLRLKQCAVVEFLTGEDVTPKQIPRIMRTVYGDCVNAGNVCRWANKCRDGEVEISDLHDNRRLGYPITPTTFLSY